MFKAFFNIIINMIASVIQIIVWPLNQIIGALLPDFSSQVQSITNVFGTVFNYISWAISIIPTPVIIALSFMLVCEIAKHTIFNSTYMLIRVWTIFQKIKFW